MPKIGFYDYLTFACVLIIMAAFLTVLVMVLGLPGRIARKRKHPEADAIYVMGWLGFLGVVPWIQAFMWAFKPTDVVDIRRFPKQEREAEDLEFAAPQPSSRRRRRSRRHDEPAADSDTQADDSPNQGGTSESDQRHENDDPQDD